MNHYLIQYALDGDILRLEAVLSAKSYFHRVRRKRRIMLALVILTLGCTGAVLATGLTSDDARRSEVVAIPTHAGVY